MMAIFRNIGRMNLRTHRKIAIIDGRVSYVGGHGIAEQWTGDGQDKDHWRDTAIRAEGPVVTTLQGVFCENWIEETGEVPAGEKYFRSSRRPARSTPTSRMRRRADRCHRFSFSTTWRSTRHVASCASPIPIFCRTRTPFSR